MREYIINFNGEMPIKAKNKKIAAELADKILNAMFNAYSPDTRAGYLVDAITDNGKIEE